MKVFRINDYEWYAAETMEQAIDCCVKLCGVGREEAYDESIAHELTKDEMEKYTYQEDDGVTRTFAQEIQLMIDSDVEFPCFFAGTDF